MTFAKYKASILLSSLGRVMHLNKIAHLTDTPLRGLLLHNRESIPYCYAHWFYSSSEKAYPIAIPTCSLKRNSIVTHILRMGFMR